MRKILLWIFSLNIHSKDVDTGACSYCKIHHCASSLLMGKYSCVFVWCEKLSYLKFSEVSESNENKSMLHAPAHYEVFSPIFEIHVIPLSVWTQSGMRMFLHACTWTETKTLLEQISNTETGGSSLFAFLCFHTPSKLDSL